MVTANVDNVYAMTALRAPPVSAKRMWPNVVPQTTPCATAEGSVAVASVNVAGHTSPHTARSASAALTHAWPKCKLSLNQYFQILINVVAAAVLACVNIINFKPLDFKELHWMPRLWLWAL